jgi:hypothetical protein
MTEPVRLRGARCGRRDDARTGSPRRRWTHDNRYRNARAGHLIHIYGKLGVGDRAAAVAEAFNRGLLTPEPRDNPDRR